ncbi:hypothetical protein [Treponema sp.]|nr:hypothetical protein [Treponema sp.]
MKKAVITSLDHVILEDTDKLHPASPQKDYRRESIEQTLKELQP